MFENHRQVVQAANTLPELKSMPKPEFVSWIAENEKIYQAFRRFAIEAVDKGRTRFSAYMIRERVRWYTNIEYRGDFKISNNVTPYMSRLLALDIPILDKIFAKKNIDLSDFADYQSQAELFDYRG